MAVITIESLDDPRLTPYRNLKATNVTRYARRFVAEGRKLVDRLLASSLQVDSLLVGDRHWASSPELAECGCDVFLVPEDWVERIIGFNFHRGILACGLRPGAADLATLVSRDEALQTVVVCPSVQDPENLGTILRLASAFGVTAVALGSASCDPFSRRVLRVSMGAAFRVPIVVSDDLERLLIDLRQRTGTLMWAAVVDRSAAAAHGIERPRRLALLLGNEGHGLEPNWLELCDQRVTIPIDPNVDSLNVSVAAAILLYELTKR